MKGLEEVGLHIVCVRSQIILAAILQRDYDGVARRIAR